MITRMLLASVLAIGAGSFAGCGDTDCPSTVSAGTSCSTQGLTCSDTNHLSCACSDGHWFCVEYDMPAPAPHDLSMRDLANPTD